jgi:hypothetical protein
MDKLEDTTRRSNHYLAYNEMIKYSGIQSDDKLKEITLANIKSHPVKYLQNCFCNLGRILFNFPYSYKLQSPGTLLRIPLNGIICLLIIFSLIPTFKNWKKIKYPIRFMLFFAAIYLGGSIFASAETRMFTVIVPILLVWISYILQRTMTLNLQFKEKSPDNEI